MLINPLGLTLCSFDPCVDYIRPALALLLDIFETTLLQPSYINDFFVFHERTNEIASIFKNGQQSMLAVDFYLQIPAL